MQSIVYHFVGNSGPFLMIFSVRGATAATSDVDVTSGINIGT